LPEAVPADVITTALYARFRSRQEHIFGEKMLSAVRFGLIRSVTWLRSGDLTKRPGDTGTLQPVAHPPAGAE
jgi:hypothetical protein